MFCFFSSIYVQFSKISPLKSGESSERSRVEKIASNPVTSVAVIFFSALKRAIFARFCFSVRFAPPPLALPSFSTRKTFDSFRSRPGKPNQRKGSGVFFPGENNQRPG